MSIAFKILLSRFLTRFGDQSWDFTIPLILIAIFPGHIQTVAGYFLLSKIAQFFLNPLVLRWIDQLPRKTIYKIGIGSQTLSVIASWVLIISKEKWVNGALVELPLNFFLILSLVGIIGSLGSTLMEISVGYDLAADLISENELAAFNSRLKQVDLLTEVTAPLITGVILMLPVPYLGFSFIALLNLLTFFPEYYLLRSIHEQKNDLQKVWTHELISNPIKEFADGIEHFRDSRYVIPMLAYAFLWLSILSPHGVLLTGYLKDSAKLSEIQISFFRGGGALFGLLPTLLYTPLRKKLGLNRAAKFFLAQQLVFILCACVFFFLPVSFSIWGFLLMILISRIGLYGFSIAESEVRQVFIPPANRGRINGVGVSLTSLATLAVFFLGTVLPSSISFTIMVCLSVGAVGIAFLTLLFWKDPYSKP